MASTEGALLALFGVALLAATVNGALGYGVSSLTVPLALLFFPNRILSPALVLIELAINSWLVVTNRESLAAARGRAMPIIVGLIPGILIGSYLLTSANPGVLKFWTYVVLLPLILSQAAGYRRPIHAERAVGVPLGLGVGVLYSTTTISGPPLALMFNNQGVGKNEFRAALGTVRIVETTTTAIVYGFPRALHLAKHSPAYADRSGCAAGTSTGDVRDSACTERDVQARVHEFRCVDSRVRTSTDASRSAAARLFGCRSSILEPHPRRVDFRDALVRARSFPDSCLKFPVPVK